MTYPPINLIRGTCEAYGILKLRNIKRVCIMGKRYWMARLAIQQLSSVQIL